MRRGPEAPPGGRRSCPRLSFPCPIVSLDTCRAFGLPANSRRVATSKHVAFCHYPARLRVRLRPLRKSTERCLRNRRRQSRRRRQSAAATCVVRLDCGGDRVKLSRSPSGELEVPGTNALMRRLLQKGPELLLIQQQLPKKKKWLSFERKKAQAKTA